MREVYNSNSLRRDARLATCTMDYIYYLAHTVIVSDNVYTSKLRTGNYISEQALHSLASSLYRPTITNLEITVT